MEQASGKTATSNLDKHYKILVLNDEDLKQVRSFRTTLRRFYSMLALAIFGVCFLTILLVSLTPLKQLIPGYGDINSNAAFIELNEKLVDLEQQVESQRIYTEGFKTMIDNIDPDVKKENNVGEVVKSVTPIVSNLSDLHFQFLMAPVKGEISQGFKPEVEHYGIDITAPKNEPIIAIADGTVIQSDWSLKDGNSVSVLHDDELISIYKHNSVLLKEVGNKVKAGEAIAIIGNSGELSSGPHLHFELWHKGEPIDPNIYIHF